MSTNTREEYFKTDFLQLTEENQEQVLSIIEALLLAQENDSEK